MKLLPVEIIEQIITLACIDNSRNDYEYIRIKRQPREYLRGTTNIQIEPSTAVVLTHVSKLWRGIAISTKDIWKKVEVVFTILPDQKRVHPVWVSSFPLASAFKRSDPSPIEVLIEGWRNRSEGSDDKWHDDIVARKVFAAQLWRWRSLELVGGSELSDLQSEWGLRLTQLQQVKLYGCPALQILPLPLRQIRDLALDEHATGIRSYGIENLLRVLSKLLSLETLRIRMTQGRFINGPRGVNLKVTLKNLRTLEIQDHYSTLLPHLATRLNLPKLTTLDILVSKLGFVKLYKPNLSEEVRQFVEATPTLNRLRLALCSQDLFKALTFEGPRHVESTVCFGLRDAPLWRYQNVRAMAISPFPEAIEDRIQGVFDHLEWMPLTTSHWLEWDKRSEACMDRILSVCPPLHNDIPSPTELLSSEKERWEIMLSNMWVVKEAAELMEKWSLSQGTKSLFLQLDH